MGCSSKRLETHIISLFYEVIKISTNFKALSNLEYSNYDMYIGNGKQWYEATSMVSLDLQLDYQRRRHIQLLRNQEWYLCFQIRSYNSTQLDPGISWSIKLISKLMPLIPTHHPPTNLTPSLASWIQVIWFPVTINKLIIKKESETSNLRQTNNELITYVLTSFNIYYDFTYGIN